MAAASSAKFFWLIKALWFFFRPQLLYMPFRNCPRFHELQRETLKSEEFQKRLRPYKVKKWRHLVEWLWGPRRRMKEAAASSKCGWDVSAVAGYGSGSDCLMKVSWHCVVPLSVLGPRVSQEASPFGILFPCLGEEPGDSVCLARNQCLSEVVWLGVRLRGWGCCLHVQRVIWFLLYDSTLWIPLFKTIQNINMMLGTFKNNTLNL